MATQRPVREAGADTYSQLAEQQLPLPPQPRRAGGGSGAKLLAGKLQEHQEQ